MSAETTEVFPVAAVLECPICGNAAVLRRCFVLRNGGTEQMYGFYPDCRSKTACAKEIKRRGLTERYEVLRDDDGQPVRIKVASR